MGVREGICSYDNPIGRFVGCEIVSLLRPLADQHVSCFIERDTRAFVSRVACCKRCTVAFLVEFILCC